MKFLIVCGARPNFMKVASLMEAFGGYPSVQALLVHTGQHYDPKLSQLFFDELSIPRPAVNLEVGSGSHAQQTSEIMSRFEPVVLEHRPDAVIVVGDVNSTIACALVASKLGIKVAHVEAGLRSFDRSMPEEINRVLTDAISDYLFVSEPSGMANLKAEGVPDEHVFFVGNTMIDTLLRHRAKAQASTVLRDLGVQQGQYVVVTLHRPSNVDEPAVFSSLLNVMDHVSRHFPVVFPMHPRTRANLGRMGLEGKVRGISGLRLVDPLGYLDFLCLTANCFCVLTDSGGIQEETTILRIPCLTLRNNTERPVTVEVGTNRLVGQNPRAVQTAFDDLLSGGLPQGQTPPMWDGQAGRRIADTLVKRFGSR